MIHWRFAFALFLGTLLLGCQYRVPLMNTPVEVSGKLSKGGQPLGNVILMLQPLGSGHPAPMKTGADGSFKGTIVPGKYAYFLTPIDSNDLSSLKGVDASLLEANMQRTLSVESGQSTLNVDL